MPLSSRPCLSDRISGFALPLTNKIGPAGATKLGEMLAINTSLTHLVLPPEVLPELAHGAVCRCSSAQAGGGDGGEVGVVGGVGCAGLGAVAEGLRVNGSLRSLVLDFIPVGDSAATALAGALGRKGNTSLTRLGLVQNAVSEDGLVEVARRLGGRDWRGGGVEVEGLELWRVAVRLQLPASCPSWSNRDVLHQLWLRKGGEEEEEEEQGRGGREEGEGGCGARVEVERVERELKKCRGELALQQELVQGLVRVKREKQEASAAAQAHLRGVQQTLGNATCLVLSPETRRVVGGWCVSSDAEAAMRCDHAHTHTTHTTHATHTKHITHDAVPTPVSAAEARQQELLTLQAKMAALAAQMQEDEEAMECSVCMEARASTVLFPCGHCFCCAPRCPSAHVRECPCCRKPVEARTSLYGTLPASSSSHTQIAGLIEGIGRAARGQGEGTDTGEDGGGGTGGGGGGGGDGGGGEDLYTLNERAVS
jgi:uncharacterized membrane protein YgcG